MNLAGVVRRNVDRHLVDGFKQNRIALGHAFRHRNASGQLEGHLVAVNRVELAIGERDGKIDDGKSERTFGGELLDSVLHRRNVLPRNCPADNLVGEFKAASTGLGGDVHGHIPEHSVPAGLPLEPAVLGNPSANGLPVGNTGLAGVRLHIELALQLFEGDLEMDRPLTLKDQLVRVLILVVAERGILLDQALQAGRQLDLVLSVGGGDGECVNRGQGADLLRGFRLPGTRFQNVAGANLLHAAEPHDIAEFGARDLAGLASGHHLDAADPASPQRLPVGDFPRPYAGVRNLAAVLGVERLENLDSGFSGRIEAKGIGSRLRSRRVMAKRLQDPSHAEVALGRPEIVGHNLAVAHGAGGLGEYLLDLRHLVLEQHLKNPVVEVRQRLQELLPRKIDVVLELRRKLDLLGFLAFHVRIGAQAREIDIAGNGLVAGDGKVPHQVRHPRGLADGLKDLGHRVRDHVDLVDVDHVRDSPGFECPEDGRRGSRTADGGLNDDDRHIRDGQCVQRLLHELDRTGAVENGPIVAEIVHFGDGHLGAHVAAPRLNRRIADRGSVLDRAASLDCSGSGKKALHEGGLAAEKRPNQCDTPGVLHTASPVVLAASGFRGRSIPRPFWATGPRSVRRSRRKRRL